MQQKIQLLKVSICFLYLFLSIEEKPYLAGQSDDGVAVKPIHRVDETSIHRRVEAHTGPRGAVVKRDSDVHLVIAKDHRPEQ
jgi:hypothetical protein